MKYPKLRELKEAIKVLIKGPVTTKFPFEPYTPPEIFRGRPVPSQEGCTGCSACAEVCPPGAIKVENDLSVNPPVRRLVWYYDECIFCGQCERICTTRAETIPGVRLSQEYDLATTDRSTLRSETITKTLICCTNCSVIISTKEHFEWVAKKLGPKVYGNINLTNIISEKFFSLSKPIKFKQFIQRENMFEILCPKCRRRILLFDEYGPLVE